jgi:hypothetical protein
MQDKEKGVRVRFATTGGTLGSRSGHTVRTITERQICDWLGEKNIAHRHAGEVFIVKAATNGSPMLFVPDILLTKKTKDGRTIVIETLHNFSPKRGGLKTFAAFCKQFRDKYFTVLVAKKTTLASIPKGICDARVELENLDTLSRKLGLGTKSPSARAA